MSATPLVRRSVLCALVTASLVLSPALAGAGSSFWDRKEEGWFWYDDPVIAEEPDEEEPDEPEPPIAMPAPEPAPEIEPQPVAPEEPAPLSAAWFSENLERYLHAAIDDPTPENVRAYFYLQRIGLEKAQQFSEMGQQVVAGDPFLDNISARPTNTLGVRTMQREAHGRRTALLDEIFAGAGIGFFFDADCGEMCSRQATILQGIADRHDVSILAIAIGGERQFPTLTNADYVVDQGQAEEIGVLNTPALYLMRPPGDWVPLSQGFLGETEVVDRMLLGALQAEWITQEQYDSTRSTQRQHIALDAARGLEEMPDDPADLVRLIQQVTGETSSR